MKKVLISLLVLTLLVASALSSCEWLKAEEPHECESLCTECGGCLNRECEDSACAEKCEGHFISPPHEQSKICSECGGCLDNTCSEHANQEKCKGHHKCESLCEDCGGCFNDECAEEACADKCACHYRRSLCFECGGCIYTVCTEVTCIQKCSCAKYVNVENEIVDVLLKYLQTFNAEYYITPWTTEKKISKIKDGSMHPLLVTFDSVNTYYISVYFSGEHEIPDTSYLLGECFCVDDYVWVRFDNFEDIKRTYNNRDILAIFAIREINSVSNISSADADVPEFIAYEMIYRNISKNDYIHPKNLSTESFVYLVESNADTVYYNPGSHLKYFYYMDCILFNNEYHLIFPNDLEYLKYEFGEYYDELIAIADTESYSEIYANGNEVFYTIIKINDFAELLKGE